MLLVLLPTHPHLLEGAARAKYRSTNPWGEALLRTCDDLNADILRGYFGHLLLETLHESAETSVTTSDYYVLEEVTSDVDISFTNRVDDHILHACKSFQIFLGREHCL